MYTPTFVVTSVYVPVGALKYKLLFDVIVPLPNTGVIVVSPVSEIVTLLSCIMSPEVPLNRATELSVEEDGGIT